MLVVGLTGGISSGKSTVTSWFLEKGIVVLDADRIVRQLQKPGSQLLYDLAHEFGSSVIKENGELARDVLGSIIFHDESAKYKLNDEKVLELAEQVTKLHENEKQADA